MSKVKVIAINGLSRSGKDSFVDFVRKKVLVVFEHSTISKPKNALESRLMIHPHRKGEKERKFLNIVKKAWIEYNNGPFKEVVELVKTTESMHKFMTNINRVLFFVHVREPEEIRKLKNYFKDDFISVIVTKPRIEIQPGDEEVCDWIYDYEIYNESDLKWLDILADEFIVYLNERFD